MNLDTVDFMLAGFKDNDIEVNVSNLFFGQNPNCSTQVKEFNNISHFIEWCYLQKEIMKAPIKIRIFIKIDETVSFNDYKNNPQNVSFMALYNIEKFNKKIKL